MTARTIWFIPLFIVLAGNIVFAAEDQHSLGLNAFSSGDYKTAKKHFLAAEIATPNDPVAFYNNALAYFYLEEYFPAMGKLNVAISLNPDFDRAYYARGVLRLKEGQKDGAEKDFKKACELGYKDGCTVFNNI